MVLAQQGEEGGPQRAQEATPTGMQAAAAPDGGLSRPSKPQQHTAHLCRAFDASPRCVSPPEVHGPETALAQPPLGCVHG